MNLTLMHLASVTFYRVRGSLLGPAVFLTMMFAIEGSFWSQLSAKEDGSVGTYSTSQLLFYSFCALLIHQWTSCSGETDSLAAKIESGALDRYLLRPISFLQHMTHVQLGVVLARSLTLLPVLLAIGLLLRPEGFSVGWLALVVIIPLAGIMNFLLNNTLAALTFYFRESYAFVSFKETLFWVLSGTLIPLDFFPTFIQQALPYFPPAYVVYYPTQILLGRAEPLPVFVGMAILTVACWFVFTLVWGRGLGRYQAFGG